MERKRIIQKRVQMVKKSQKRIKIKTKKLKKLQNLKSSKRDEILKSNRLLDIYPIPIPRKKFRQLFQKNSKRDEFINKNNIEERFFYFTKTVKYLKSKNAELCDEENYEDFKNFVFNKNDFESESEKFFENDFDSESEIIYENENKNEKSENENDNKKFIVNENEKFSEFKKKIILKFLKKDKKIAKKKKIVIDILNFIKIQSYEFKKNYRCKFCDLYFKGQSALGGHITKNHAEESKRNKILNKL